MRKFVGGFVLGLVLSASMGYAMTHEARYLKLISLELQRIANALDRLVSLEYQQLPKEKS